MTNTARSNDSGRIIGHGYRIRVAGVLGEEWSGLTGGMSVSVNRSEAGASYSELRGDLPDEAALMGVLESLYTHGARLLVVERTDRPGTDPGSPIDPADQSGDARR